MKIQTITDLRELKGERCIHLWIPREVADLWTDGGSAVEECCGDYQHNFLDILRSSIDDFMVVALDFGESYGSYAEYRKDLEKTATALSKSGIDEAVEWAQKDRRIEEGKQLMAKGITLEKAKRAVEILEKLLE